MQDLSLHLVDIIENSVRGGASLIKIKVGLDTNKNLLTMYVEDNGMGMDAETLSRAQEPFYSSKKNRKKKIGLGIPLFKQNAQQCGGMFSMSSTLGVGTCLTASCNYDHIDRLPMGKLNDTLLTSILGHPEVDYEIYLYRQSGTDLFDFRLNTAEIKQELAGVPINYPDVILFLTQLLNEANEKIKLEEL